jgi:glycosyltransferase involved in cell wall biosynthesis
VAIVHDYLTQRGGAERVVLSMLKAFPEAAVYTSLYEPRTTFPEFASADVRPLRLNRVRSLRRHHRLALPLLALVFSRLRIDAEVVLCSSSGWAHGVRASGRKVVYCYNPPRWLYQAGEYLGRSSLSRRAVLGLLAPRLRRWDIGAARSADCYLTSSRAVRERIRSTYGIEPEIVPPPPTITPTGATAAVPGVEPGFLLCVSRLLPYKNIQSVIDAFAQLPAQRLVIAGSGPLELRLRNGAPPTVRVLGQVTDEQLRWLYANCRGLVAASYEDYGLTPLECGTFGKPVAALRWGGFLDTVQEGVTGVFFDRPTGAGVRSGVEDMLRSVWHPATIRAHAEIYAESRFIERLRAIVTGQRAIGALAGSAE